MGRVCAVTGFVPIPNHPRSEKEYHQLGAKLLALPVSLFRTELEDTWLHREVQARLAAGATVTHAVSDNPAKNTLAYHCVQHQKTTWMLEASARVPDADVFVWLDYGIFHQPGITASVIGAFLERARDETEIAIPGAWQKSAEVNLEHPCWRFCGSTLVCHRQHLDALNDAIRWDVAARLRYTSHVSWEVNAWARVERMYAWQGGPRLIPIRWYKGDHNETQFTNYRGNHG